LTRGLILFEHALTSILTDVYAVNVCKTERSATPFLTLLFTRRHVSKKTKNKMLFFLTKNAFDLENITSFALFPFLILR